MNRQFPRGSRFLPTALAITACICIAARSDGQTSCFALGPTLPTSADPRSVAVGDFDGDGDLDIAVANSGANSLSVYAGDGAGVFGAASILSVGQPPNTVATADFNSDGVLDLAIANSLIFPTGSDDLTILLGIGGGNFAAPQNFGIGGTVSRPSASIAVADFNRGGNLDVAIGHTNLNIVSIFLGNGAGSFRQKS